MEIIKKINNKNKLLSLLLTKKDLDRIFIWYYKGFTNIEEDKPLFDKLQRIYNGENSMADTINCYLESEKCESCNKNPIEFIHKGELTDDKLVKLCSYCFDKLVKSNNS